MLIGTMLIKYLFWLPPWKFWHKELNIKKMQKRL